MVINGRLCGSDVDPSVINCMGFICCWVKPSETSDCQRLICNNFECLFMNFFHH